MGDSQSKIVWEEATEVKFQQILGKIPIFIRPIAAKNVGQRAEQLASQANRGVVTEKDMVDAFFAETPFGFHGPMKCDMEEFGINYQQYGHER